jgi:hypothetical protein
MRNACAQAFKPTVSRFWDTPPSLIIISTFGRRRALLELTADARSSYQTDQLDVTRLNPSPAKPMHVAPSYGIPNYSP